MSPYDVLGVPRDADAAAIRRAWHRESMRCHPDRCREPDAAERFIALTRAHDVLSDPARRAELDAQLDGRTPTPFGPGTEFRTDVALPIELSARGGRMHCSIDFGALGQRTVTLDVLAGDAPGREWRLRGMGGAGTPPGDLVIRATKFASDRRWRAEGLDVLGELPVSLADVYEGSRVTLEAPRGRLEVALPRGSVAPLRVAGQGLGRGLDRGDLVLELRVLFPPVFEPLRTLLRQASRL